MKPGAEAVMMATPQCCAYGLASCTVCNALCQEEAGAVRLCGDGVIDTDDGEACDDGNTDAGDGCSPTCELEAGFNCANVPSNCTTECGDNIQAGAEDCDDGNTETESCAYGLASCTVCNALCQEEAGAVRLCGDGVIDADDGDGVL